jgi:hypothetical protein
MNAKWFPVAAPDGRVIGVTAISILGLLLSAGLALKAWLVDGVFDDRYTLVAVVIALVLVYRFAIAVRGYSLVLRDDQPILWIDRWLPVGRRGVPLKRLHNIRIDPDLPRILNTNIFSMGGIFGWSGTATVRDMGYVDAYGMNNRKAVVLEFTAAPGKEPLLGKKAGPIYIVTPADPRAFVDAVNTLRGASPPVTPGAFQLADLPARPAAPAPASAAIAARKRKRR